MEKYLRLGYDITDGLDGEEIRHPMSGDVYHIVVWGPEAERARLRTNLVSQVKEQGQYDLIVVDFAQMSIQAVQEKLRSRAGAPAPTFIVLTNIETEEQNEYALQLFRLSRSLSRAIYIEYDGAFSMARKAAVYASTVVLLGPDASDAAHSVVGLYGPPSCTDEYVASISTSFRPKAVVLT